jgi:hypothetical protein
MYWTIEDLDWTGPGIYRKHQPPHLRRRVSAIPYQWILSEAGLQCLISMLSGNARLVWLRDGKGKRLS